MSNNTSLKYLNDYIYGSSGYESGIPDSGGGTTGTTPDSQANMIVTSELISEMGAEKGWTDNDVQNIILENVTNYRIDKCLNYGELKNMSTLLELTAPYSTDNRLVLKKYINILSPFKEIPIIFTCANGYIPGQSFYFHLSFNDDTQNQEFYAPEFNIYPGIEHTESIYCRPDLNNINIQWSDTTSGEINNANALISYKIGEEVTNINMADNNYNITIDGNIDKNYGIKILNFSAENLPDVQEEPIRTLKVTGTYAGTDGGQAQYRVGYSHPGFYGIETGITTSNGQTEVDFQGENTTDWYFYPINADITSGPNTIIIRAMSGSFGGKTDVSVYFDDRTYINKVVIKDDLLLITIDDKWKKEYGKLNVTITFF